MNTDRAVHFHSDSETRAWTTASETSNNPPCIFNKTLATFLRENMDEIMVLFTLEQEKIISNLCGIFQNDVFWERVDLVMSVAVWRLEMPFLNHLHFFKPIKNVLFVCIFVPVWISCIKQFKIKEVYIVINQRFIDVKRTVILDYVCRVQRSSPMVVWL